VGAQRFKATASDAVRIELFRQVLHPTGQRLFARGNDEHLSRLSPSEEELKRFPSPLDLLG